MLKSCIVAVTAAVQAMTITGEDTEGAVILEVTQEATAREVLEVMILVVVVEGILHNNLRKRVFGSLKILVVFY